MGSRKFLPFTIPVLLSAALLVGADEPPIPDEAPIPLIDLTELRENRSIWLGKEIRFIFQLDGELETWRPWVTRFGVDEFQAYSVWSDSSLLWIAEDYRDTTPRVFSRRGSLAEKLMSDRGQFDRFEVRGIVHSIFLDEPWIEILEVRGSERARQPGGDSSRRAGSEVDGRDAFRARSR